LGLWVCGGGGGMRAGAGMGGSAGRGAAESAGGGAVWPREMETAERRKRASRGRGNFMGPPRMVRGTLGEVDGAFRWRDRVAEGVAESMGKHRCRQEARTTSVLDLCVTEGGDGASMVCELRGACAARIYFMEIVMARMMRACAAAMVVAGMAVEVFAGAPAMGPAATGPASRPAMVSFRAKPPAVGEKAPALVLNTIDGKKVDLAEAVKKGPVVVIELRGWVGYQCPICTAQVNELVGNSKEILGKAAQVIFVYPGPAEGLKAHAEEFVSGKGVPAGYTFVMDPDMAFVSAWGLRWSLAGETAYPSTFVVDKAGVVRFAKVSGNHGDRASVADVVKALDAVK